MKSDPIVLGAEYVVAVKQKHVLIPGTEMTYEERWESFKSLDLDRLPKAAVLEHDRLEWVVLGGGLESRISRCRCVYLSGGFINEASLSDAETTHGGGAVFKSKRLGIVATPVEKLASPLPRSCRHRRATTHGLEPCRTTK
jgi:hypothetical protein